MLDSPLISPISLFGSTGVSSIAFQPSTAASSAFVPALLDNARSSVDLSSEGQLLLAVSLFQDGLDALQGSTSDATPTVLTATAQAFADAFNTLLGTTLQTVIGTLQGSAFADQLVQVANGLELQDIGIELQPATASEITGAGFTLSIDRNALNSALADDAAGTAAQLAVAIGTFSDLASGFVAQVSGSVASLVDLTLLGTGAGQQTDLNAALGLPAVAVLNGVSLSGLDLAIAGVSAGDIVAAGGGVTQETLTAAFLALNSATTSAATIETTADVNSASATTGNVSPLAITAVADTSGTEDEAAEVSAAVGTGQGLLSANPVTTTVVAATGAAVAATTDLGASASALALQLQRLLLDPTFHVTNNLINPAYAALIAASHLSDFVAPVPVINPDTFAADVPGPVSPIAMAHAIAYYSEAAGEKFSRDMRRT